MAYSGSALNVAGGGAITTVAADELTNINRQLDQFCKQQAYRMTNAAGNVVARDSSYTVKCYVPLSVIFPQFLEIRDAGTIFLSAG